MASRQEPAGSFRDPSGFVYLHDGVLLRQVNPPYRNSYDHLMDSGLYQALVEAGLLIPHTEVDPHLARTDNAYKVLRPEAIPFISYPYEWCFSQLKDAALTTLAIQERALAFDMSLKDASAYNIQFVGGKPTLIDTLSFERYQEGVPWVAYRQFCQHFLAPLALMSYCDVRLGRLLQTFIDGIPLDLAAGLLPRRTRRNMGLLMHLHLHARSQRRFADADVSRETVRGQVSRQALLGIVASLESSVARLKWDPRSTDWADYYDGDSYDEAGTTHKCTLVEQFIREAAPEMVWDLGGNVGVYSRLASKHSGLVVSLDNDPGCIELSYRRAASDGERNLLPLVIDLTTPSPAIGWENRERMSLLERGPADAALALALVHHLAISNNVPLLRLADFFGGVCRWLIVEFVPKSDPKVQRLLAMREDIFEDYTQQGFEAAFGLVFAIERSERVANSDRTMYLMRRK
jgi:hypothetical protein